MNHDELKFTVYVVFHDTNKWYFKWCKKGFQHVRIFKPYSNVLISINPQLSHTDVQVYDKDIAIEAICGCDCTIVQYCTDINPVQIISGLGYTTCIDTVKRLIGVKGFFFTPYQLYKRLIQ